MVGCIGIPPSTVTPGMPSHVLSKDRGLWMEGARVNIKDLHPGCCPGRSMEFKIGNGASDNVVREVYISIEPEDDNDLKGYEQLPSEYYSWFTISHTYFVLQPGEEKVVTVTVMMPEDADYSDKKARCELLVLGYTVVETTVNSDGETVNLVSNIPIGIASEWYIETF